MAENAQSIEVNLVPPGFEVAIKYDIEGSPKSDYLIVSKDLLQRENVSFVIQRKSGFDCENSLYSRDLNKDLHSTPLTCKGELEMRELRDNEKAATVQTSARKLLLWKKSEITPKLCFTLSPGQHLGRPIEIQIDQRPRQTDHSSGLQLNYDDQNR